MDILDSMQSHELLLLALFSAFLISLVLTPVVRGLARRKSLLDLPNHRSSHSIPVPRLGGVAIVIATLSGILLLGEGGNWRLALVLGAAALMAIVGLVDDLKSVTTLQKYAPQLASAVLAAIALQPAFDISTPFFEFRLDGAIAMALTVFWVTAFINAFNFMDGVDGISGGVGLVTAVALTLVTSGNAALLLLPLAAALAGFLLWNIHPASIFMGDGGSQFVGFTLAVGALYWPGFEVNFVVVLIVFAPFLFDTGFTLVWRLWNRMEVFRAHRTHLYQRLTSVALGHRDVANLYIGAAALCAVAAVAYATVGVFGQILLISALLLTAYAYVTLVSRLEEAKHATESGSLRRRVANARSRTWNPLNSAMQKPANVRREGSTE